MPEPEGKRKRKARVEQAVVAEGPREWEAALARLPAGWETAAGSQRALVRKRAVQSAGDLLRLVWAYSLWDWPLRQVGAWACILGLAQLSDVAVRKRLRHTHAWLSMLVGQALGQVRGLTNPNGVRLRLIDATVITQPGSRGTDWRVHVGFDVGQSRLDDWEVTDGHGGENLLRHAIARGEILVADRAYGHRADLGYLLSQGAQCLIRINGYNLPVFTARGQRLDVRAWLASLAPATTRRERRVRVYTPQGDFELRLIAQRLPPQAAAAARQRARQTSRKNGTQAHPLTAVMAGWVVVVSNLPPETWPAASVLALYRVRWQVELLLKRCKSLIGLNRLRCKDPELVQVYLLGKALGVLLVEQPTGLSIQSVATWFDDIQRPVSLWRWTAVWWDHLRAAVRGVITTTMLTAALTHLSRYLCDSPRRRPQQLALTRLKFSLHVPA